jgi:putative spermidine/putrescine transport system permease protein
MDGFTLTKRFPLLASFLPLIVLMAVAYVWPIAAIVRGSFSDEDGLFAGRQNYTDVLGSYYFWDSLWFSLRVSLISTFLSIVLAAALAMALRETFAGKKIALFISQYNLSIPRMAAAMIMVFLLSQTGLLSAVSHALGFTESVGGFPWLVYDAKGKGLILVFVWKFFPYICISMLGVLQGASIEYEQQAAALGVGKWRRFFFVVLPTVAPAIAVSSILVFAASFGDYEAPAILGSAQERSLSVMLYLKYADPDMRDRPEAFAIMVLMGLVLMAVVVAYRRAAAGGTRKRGL